MLGVYLLVALTLATEVQEKAPEGMSAECIEHVEETFSGLAIPENEESCENFIIAYGPVADALDDGCKMTLPEYSDPQLPKYSAVVRAFDKCNTLLSNS